jgi:hypothetical protein
LREHGVVLVGAPPEQLVAPVDPDELRAEARTTMREAAARAYENVPLGRWAQQYLVLSFCRMLHTLESGRVVSKRDAAEWALRELDPRRHDLIRKTLADRPHTWELVDQVASTQAAAETLADRPHTWELVDQVASTQAAAETLAFLDSVG